ncbi:MULTISPECIES: hypothetical protein [unclassified Achromobacter]|nr:MULTISPECIES: hypothetical protein [unclassified Achromobacter]
MYQATTKFLGSVIWTGSKSECLEMVQRLGMTRSEVSIKKIG